MTIYQDRLHSLFPTLLTNHKIGWAGGEINSNYIKLKTFCKENNLPFLENKQAETLWRVYHNDFSEKKCECGSPVSFDAFCRGYHSYCSRKCSAFFRDSQTRKGFNTPEGRAKGRKTLFKKYGVDHQSHVNEIHEKSQAKRYKRYRVTSPSGIDYYVQGYERFVIYQLWEKYDESDVICKKSDIPKIWYHDSHGKKRKYYPDFYIVSENKIIEVKSTWTLDSDNGLTEYKKQGTLAAGYDFELIVHSE